MTRNTWSGPHGGVFGPPQEPSDTDPDFIAIIEWPSKDAESAWLNDPDYVPHTKARP